MCELHSHGNHVHSVAQNRAALLRAVLAQVMTTQPRLIFFHIFLTCR